MDVFVLLSYIRYVGSKSCVTVLNQNTMLTIYIKNEKKSNNICSVLHCCPCRIARHQEQMEKTTTQTNGCISYIRYVGSKSCVTVLNQNTMLTIYIKNEKKVIIYVPFYIVVRVASHVIKNKWKKQQHKQMDVFLISVTLVQKVVSLF